MKRLVLITLLLVITSIYAQGQKDVILQIDDEQVTLEEFKRIYFKNNKDSALTKESLEEYLELFINFKLKVHEAKALDLHKQDKFVKELATYRQQLVKPYLTDSATDEQLIREAYERMKYIVRAKHILFKVPQKAKPADTLKIYNQAKEVLAKLKNGADFESMAKKHSMDPSVRYNNGDLCYFSAFKMVYPFENAAFSLDKGEISNLVRTNFGYHIIKVTDRIPAPGTVEAAHIMIRLPQSATSEQAKAAKSRIKELYNKLEAGADFADVASKHSEDPQTAKKGGQLPKFTPGRMLPNFEEKIFSQQEGTYSEPFRTKVGWHIVKLISKQPTEPLAKIRPQIKRKLSKTARANLSRKKVVQRLKKEYNLQCNKKVMNELAAAINNDSLINKKWYLDQEINMDEVLCTFADNETLKVGELAQYLKKRAKQTKKDAEQFISRQKNNFVNNKIIDYEKAHLEEKYPDFAWLMKEYHDGILLFNITDSVVWKKAVKDTTGLKAYYEDHKNEYMWDKRMQAEIIEVSPSYKLRKTKRIIKKHYKKGSKDQIESHLHNTYEDTTINVIFDSGIYEKGTNKYVDATNWETGLHLAEELDNKQIFIYNDKVLEPQPKAFSEIKGLVTADYQNYLEQKWIASLREKYDVEVHEELLDKLLN